MRRDVGREDSEVVDQEMISKKNQKSHAQDGFTINNRVEYLPTALLQQGDFSDLCKEDTFSEPRHVAVKCSDLAARQLEIQSCPHYLADTSEFTSLHLWDYSPT